MLNLKVKRLETLKEKTLGLIGREKVTPVIFETRFGIHTFGLKVPIDVLILDNKNKVARKIIKNGFFLSINLQISFQAAYNAINRGYKKHNHGSNSHTNNQHQ